MKIRDTVYHADSHSIECLVCGNCIELSESTCSNPEVLLQVREQYEIDHAGCNDFKAETVSPSHSEQWKAGR